MEPTSDAAGGDGEDGTSKDWWDCPAPLHVPVAKGERAPLCELPVLQQGLTTADCWINLYSIASLSRGQQTMGPIKCRMNELFFWYKALITEVYLSCYNLCLWL